MEPNRKRTTPISVSGSTAWTAPLRKPLFVRADTRSSNSPKRQEFNRAVLREEALSELWFSGGNDDFVSFIFPVLLGGKEIANWEQAKTVKPDDRSEVLRTLKLRRCAAMLRRLESYQINAETMMAGQLEQQSAMARYEAALLEDLNETSSETERREFNEWLDIIEDRQEHIYRITEEEEKLCQQYYMDDEQLAEALRELNERAAKQQSTPSSTPTPTSVGPLQNSSAGTSHSQQRSSVVLQSQLDPGPPQRLPNSSVVSPLRGGTGISPSPAQYSVGYQHPNSAEMQQQEAAAAAAAAAEQQPPPLATSIQGSLNTFKN